MKWAVILISVLVFAGVGTFIGYRATEHHGLDCYIKHGYSAGSPGHQGKGALPGGGYDFSTPPTYGSPTSQRICK